MQSADGPGAADDLSPFDRRLIRFGLNLKRARQIAGMTQQRLAELSGVSQSVISRAERGRHRDLPSSGS
jgi:DNA-binding XRE family transcriptional regulator